jgi:hypothetical protein
MRVLSYILIVAGICLLAGAGYQEFHGITNRPVRFMPFSKRDVWDHRRYNAYQFAIPVLKKNNPALFREFMNYHWVYASMVLVGGVLLNGASWRYPQK